MKYIIDMQVTGAKTGRFQFASKTDFVERSAGRIVTDIADGFNREVDGKSNPPRHPG